MADVNANLDDRLNEQYEELERQRAVMRQFLALRNVRRSLSAKLETLRARESLCNIKLDGKVSDDERAELLKSIDALVQEEGTLLERIKSIDDELAGIDFPESGSKNFNKYLCFSNIKELLKKSSVKIGQIEHEAGCQVGYMSRLDKPKNTGAPSAEFIVTAAKMLGTSLDTLLTVDLTEMTPTEQYLVAFFDKLKRDTVADKLDWNEETADSLNRLEMDQFDNIDHPLFSYETFYEESSEGTPKEVSRIVLNSHTFGPATAISGSCYNLRLKNGTFLYLMDISKSQYYMNDQDAFAKEVWLSSPQTGKKFLVSNKEVLPLAGLVDTLFATVADRMKHPKIKGELKNAIDAFMKDDFEDDDKENESVVDFSNTDDEIPF